MRCTAVFATAALWKSPLWTLVLAVSAFVSLSVTCSTLWRRCSNGFASRRSSYLRSLLRKPVAGFFATITDEKERLLAENAVRRLFRELSTEGVATASRREDLCGEWLTEVVSRPSFYLGDLTAAGFAEEKGVSEMADHFARFGQRRGEFQVAAATGALVPKTFVLKRVAAVFLEAAAEAIEADTLLLDLHRI